MNKTTKSPKQLERHLKGVSNHRRIQILMLVAKNPNISLDEIAKRLEGNMKMIAEHTRRLTQAGLIDKKYSGRSVVHTLSPYGKTSHKFITTF